MALSSLHYPMTPKDSSDRFDILEKEPEVVKLLKKLYDMGNVHPSVFSRLVRQKPTIAFKVSRMLKKLNMTGGVKELVRFYGEYIDKNFISPDTFKNHVIWEYQNYSRRRRREERIRRIQQEGGSLNDFHSVVSLDSHSGDISWWTNTGSTDVNYRRGTVTGDTVSYNTSTITDLTE